MSCGTFSRAAISAVQTSWSALKQKIGSEGDVKIPMLVFKNFFGDNPSTIKYFTRFGDNPESIMENEMFINHAKNNVYASLDKAIGILDQPDEIEKVKTRMGEIHKPKNITRDDFTNLGGSIVKSVEQAMGDDLTQSEKESWESVMNVLMCSFAEASSK